MPAIGFRRPLLCLAVAGRLALLTGAALGDDRAEDNYFHLSLDDLLAVEVSAQKQSQRLDEIPVTVTIVPGEVIDSPLVQDLSDLAERIPALTISIYNDATPQLYMRGIGSNLSGAADDPTVSMFYDGAYLSRASFHAMELFDIDKVEVLHGPQSGIFGKNVIGGLIQVVPNHPTLWDDHSITVAGGDRSLLATNGYSNFALFDDHVGQRLSFSVRRRDGYLDNTVTGKELGEYESWSLREQLMWSPDRDLNRQIRLSLTFQDFQGNGPAVQAEFEGGSPGANPDAPSANDAERTDLSDDGNNDRRSLLTVLDANWRLWGGQFRSQTNFLSGDISFDRPLFAVTDYRIANTGDETAREFSQEFSWSRGESADRLRGRIGLYFAHVDVDRQEAYEFADFFRLIGQEGSLTPEKPGTTMFDANATTVTRAISGSAIWRFHPKFMLTSGLHFSVDRKEIHSRASGGDPLDSFITTPYDIMSDERWDGVSGRLALSWLPTVGTSTYAVVNRGFKSGNFNSLAVTLQAAPNEADPEDVTSAELGLRHHLKPLRTRISLAGYATIYENLQLFQNTADILSPAEARIQGIEVALDWRFPGDFQSGASYAYTHARYSDFVDESGTDFSDQTMPRAPDHAAAGWVRYGRHALGGQVVGDLSLSYRSRTFSGPENTALGSTPPRTLLDVSAHYLLDGLEFTLWVKNLTDEVYDLWVVDSGQAALGRSSVQAPPRSLGVALRVDI